SPSPIPTRCAGWCGAGYRRRGPAATVPSGSTRSLPASKAGGASRTGGMLAYLSYHPLVRVHLGPLSISPHGVGIAVGFLLGARLMLPAAAKRGISEEEVYGLLTRAAIGAIVGARLA